MKLAHIPSSRCTMKRKNKREVREEAILAVLADARGWGVEPN
jgi:hypothetical protein